MPKSYDTANAAAAAGLREAMKMSKKREFAGVVYSEGGKFFYTAPQTSGGTHDVHIKVQYPKGAQLTALYHTHPEGFKSELFSRGDVEVAKRLNVPFYMGHVKDHSFRVYTPDPKEAKMRSWPSPGELFTDVELPEPEPLPLAAALPLTPTDNVLAQ